VYLLTLYPKNIDNEEVNMSPEQPSSKIGKSVGEKLRAARITQHYTQSQLAAPDFSVSYISAIERGQIHPSLRALEILATRLGMSSTQLLPNKSQQEERASAAAALSEREDDEVELDLLDSQILIIQGDATSAVTLLTELANKRLKPVPQLRQRYLLGWAYYKIARYQESEYILSEAIQVAKDLNAQYLHLHILYQLALTYSAMRNYAQAFLALQRCLHQIKDIGAQDPFFSAQIYIQLGQHYTRSEEFEPALEMFHNALAITEEFSTVQSIQAAYSSLCQYYANAKDIELATLYAYKSIQLHNTDAMKRLKSELHHYLGHAIMQTDLQRARAYLDNSMQVNEGTFQDPLTRASLLSRNAEWYFAQQDLVAAENFAHQASDLAQSFGDTIITADTLIVLGRIEYAKKDYDEGGKHLVAGLDILERIGSHEELANESVRYAALLEELGDEREAFTHFRRAFQSRQRLGK
jgi:tetratricopeptide (TPR) repeat protein